MHLAAGTSLSPQTKQYVQIFNQLDLERESLDFEIQEMLEEMDMNDHFRNLESTNDYTIQDVPKESKLGKLVDKMQERTMKIELQKKAV